MSKKVSMMSAILACSMVEQIPLHQAARTIGASKTDLHNAYTLFVNTKWGGADGLGPIITDYYEAVTAAFKRAEAMN